MRWLLEHWASVVGEDAAALTTPARRDGLTLFVEVKNETARWLLERQHKADGARRVSRIGGFAGHNPSESAVNVPERRAKLTVRGH